MLHPIRTAPVKPPSFVDEHDDMDEYLDELESYQDNPQRDAGEAFDDRLAMYKREY